MNCISNNVGWESELSSNAKGSYGSVSPSFSLTERLTILRIVDMA